MTENAATPAGQQFADRTPLAQPVPREIIARFHDYLPAQDAVDRLDERLSRARYLCGDRPTEADWRLFTTLVRFDLVYYAHFKCNLARLQDFPNLWNYLLDLYQTPGFTQTTNLEHIKVHYYWSQDTVNPTRIVPLGPRLDLTAAHDRDRLGPRRITPLPGF
mgnify:CR=1 FL=1